MGQTDATRTAVDGKKVGELTEATFTVKANGQLITTADEVIKSRGKATAEVTYTRVRPTVGVAFSVARAVIAQSVHTVTGQLPGGELIAVTGTFDQTAVKTNVGQGMTDENPTFSGSVKVI